MKKNPVFDALSPIQELIKSLGHPLHFRKLNGIVNALEIQVEDRNYHLPAVVLLCEALLSAAKSHGFDENVAARFDQVVCKLIELAEDPANRS